MRLVLVTGSAGLVGSESVRFFCDRGFVAVGIDNDMRRAFFGDGSSTRWNRDRLLEEYPDRYVHYDLDVRDREATGRVFEKYGRDIELVIHAAAQPSHDWAARDPHTDFSVNATGTLVMLEHARQHCPDAVFIFCSTNKVYGDNPNRLPLVEHPLRWEVEEDHRFFGGIDETMSVDQCKHSLFGASKLAADVLVQEYGRYFGMKSAVFRGGCLTGPNHAGAELHGFLSYLVRCAVTHTPYSVFGYKGKQVRDNIHSHDLVNAFDHFFQAPRVGEVYNIGGGRFSNCSMLEAIALCDELTGSPLQWRYDESNRIGDHVWWISDNQKFQDHFPGWKLTFSVRDIVSQILAQDSSRWTR